MKIGIVCYPTYGGSGVMATELGKALLQRDHEVHFISYSQPVRLKQMLDSRLYYHEVGSYNYDLFEHFPYESALISKLVDVAKHAKLDVLHVHYAIPHAFAAYVAKQILKEEGIEMPTVTTLHGTDITLVGKDSTYKSTVTFSINKSDAVTAVSQFLVDETNRYFSVDKEIQMVPNFVDFQRFSKKPKDHFKLAIAPNGEKIIVHTSNFRPVKRIKDIISIFAIVQKEIPSKLLLVGDGPDRSDAEEYARQLEVIDNVRFLGKIDAVEEVLSVADLFLLPSERESFGLAALEAMACQVPVVSSDAEGIPEVNIDGVTGFVNAIGDVEGMAKSAIKILSDDELNARMRQSAYEQAQQFHIDKICTQYENIYKELVVGSIMDKMGL